MSGTPDRLTAALADRYRLERELGAGGMATVYLAQDLKHDRKVAIKVLRPELAAVIGADRFLSEIKTTANLQHPQILPLFDSGAADSFLFYVMPFIEGESLRDRLNREKQLPITDAVRIATEVAGALDYAHRHNVIHRDIKPENILLHDGRALVADFGIALAASKAGGTRMTETGMSLGTPGYMSPEQATGERQLDARSDLYALGCVLYEMLTGDPPFTGSTVQAIVAKVMTEKPASIRRIRERVPVWVEDATLIALEKTPADRFASAAAFAEALTSSSGSRSAIRSLRPAAVPVYQRLALPAAVGVALVSLASTLLLLARGRASSADLGNVVIAQKTYRSETIFNARWAPDGKTIVYSAAIQGPFPRIYVVRPEYPEPEPLGPDSMHLLAVSSTGELAVLTHPNVTNRRLFNGTLARMPLGGGAPREVMEGVWGADWSPDGTKLAITHQAGDFFQLEYPPGRILHRSARNGHLSDIRVSPRGDRIALFDHPFGLDDRGSVVVVDTTGKAVTLGTDFSSLEGLAWAPDGKSVLFSAQDDRISTYQVRRAAVDRTPQIILPSAGNLTIQDAGKDGAWLVTRDDQPARVFVHEAGSRSDRDISWLDQSVNPHISADGQLVILTDQSLHGGVNYSVMLRKADGSPALTLGPGVGVAISPDWRWVIGEIPKSPPQFVLYPTGAGASRQLNWPALETVGSVAFFPDGQSLFVCGNEPNRSRRCYRSPLDASALEPVTPDSIGGGLLRPDGRALLSRRQGSYWIQPLDGTAPHQIPGVGQEEFVLRWSPDGAAIWVAVRSGVTMRVERVATSTGERSVLYTVSLPPSIPVYGIIGLALADNPRTYVYVVWIYESQLFTVTGMR